MTLTPSQARRLGADAFVFGFPLLVIAATMRRATNVAIPDGARAPLNRFAHLRRFPDANLRAIVGANPDTLYSQAWLDLAAEPMLLDLPDSGGRSYLMTVLDAWSNVVASLGPRTVGAGGRTYAIVGPHSTGELPEGAQRLDAPTSNVWLIWQLHASGRDDLEASLAIQQDLALIPLSAHGSTYESPPGTVDPGLGALAEPHRLVMAMDAPGFLAELAAQMGPNPAADIDAPLLERLAAIGLRPGKRFDYLGLPAAIREALARGIEEGKQATAQPPERRLGSGWQTIHAGDDCYGADYLRRARFANLALGIGHPEDAVFPLSCTDAHGRQLNGGHRYVLRFGPGELPPVGALWSLTVHDMDQLLIDNPIDRYALGDRDDLEIGPDGSVEIAIQHDRPNGSAANWLPAPEGDFNLMLHMYWPSQSVLDGSWSIPPIQRIA